MHIQYLRLIVEESHVQYREHICPLISSYEKNCCGCGGKATYKCSDESCNSQVYCSCFKEFDQNIITLINISSLTNMGVIVVKMTITIVLMIV